MKNGKLRFMTTVSLLLLIVGTLKCSVYMAAKQPEKKDLEVMQVGNTAQSGACRVRTAGLH